MIAAGFGLAGVTGGVAQHSVVRQHDALDVMALKRFKTNRRLWLALSFVLFLLPWFVGHIGKSADEMHAAGLFVVAIDHPEVIFMILLLALMFAIPALAVGWVIHCLIVMVVDFVRERTRNAAYPPKGLN